MDVLTDADFEEAQNDVRSQFGELEKLGVINICGVDKKGLPMIVVSACRFPLNTSEEHHQLFDFIQAKLDDYVQSDYSVVYFHYGYTKSNKPPLKYLKQMYSSFDRKYKKNIKRLIIVHPTSWMKTVWMFLKPFISAKFGQKVTYINHLSELKEWCYINQLSIPIEVKNFDNKKLAEAGLANIEDGGHLAPSSQFEVELDVIISQQGPIPNVPKELIEFLEREENISTEGIFRRSSSNQQTRDSLAIYNQGKMMGDTLNDPILAAALLKMWFRGLPKPLIPESAINYMVQVKKAEPNQKIKMLHELYNELIVPVDHRSLVKYLFKFLSKVISYESANKMGSSQIAIVFGPTICWPSDPNESLGSIQHVNNMIKWTLDHIDHVFPN